MHSGKVSDSHQERVEDKEESGCCKRKKLLYSQKNKSTLEGCVVAITGANTGIGRETALDLSWRGAKVLMLCRDQQRSQPVADEIATITGNEVEFYKLDLASLKSIRKCAEDLKASERKLDILINNAGIMMCPQGETEDGFEKQFGINHLGHFLLTELLTPLLKESSASGFHPRIVIVSSMASKVGRMHWDDLHMREHYGEIQAYNQSKLANILHCRELAKRLKDTGITVYCLHPGVVDTEIFRHADDKWYWRFVRGLSKPAVLTPLEGAQTTLYCVLEESIKDDSGKYYSSCKEAQPTRRALNEDDQRKLWDISEEMVGLAMQQNH